MTASFDAVSISFGDITGAAYTERVCGARAWLTGRPAGEFLTLAQTPVDLLPAAFQEHLSALLPQVGRQVVPAFGGGSKGATSKKFEASAQPEKAPLSALGYYRIGEDGRLMLIAKSEHYHAPLGHSFPGYALLDTARALGIPNATHNNTRGHITRLLEMELVRTAHGLAPGDEAGLNAVLARTDMRTANRVLNLETGSLATEAALKMMLARFHVMQPDIAPPVYPGRVPVVLVMGNEDGTPQGNYHGTTILTQIMRGMWPEMGERLAQAGVMRVHALRPNNMQDLEEAFARFETAPFKIAGFFHEIVMMNYGGLRLTPEFLQRAYALCERHDVPTLADEIQFCMWTPGHFMFREYGLRPSFVAIGKGFPGGEYPASRLIFSAALDCMAQFGALVTNGQEELASLAYLVTMRWAEANAERIGEVGEYYEQRMRDLARASEGAIVAVEGRRHMSTLAFRDLEEAKQFARLLVEDGFDISAQTYKAECPPAVLTKLPIIAGEDAVDLLIGRMERALKHGAERPQPNLTTKAQRTQRS
jgi:acetylornithine/succinyldiaminopimelate/putrescine aminotransferase